MSDDTATNAANAARSRRVFTLTAHVPVDADAALSDPFVAYLHALVAQLPAEPGQQDTAFGAGTAQTGRVTAVS